MRWIRWLISLPLYWAGMAALMLRQGVAASLLAAAWRIGRDPQVALAAFGASHKFEGPEAAAIRADQWAAVAGSPEMEAVFGLVALERGDLQAARQRLQCALAGGARKLSALETLQWYLAANDPADPTALTRLAEQWLERRDLAPQITRLVRLELAWAALLGGDFDQAERHAAALTDVEDCPEAEMILWAVEKHRGNESLAVEHRGRARLSGTEAVIAETLACEALGETEQAAELRARLSGSGAAAARLRTALARYGREVPAWT